MNPLPNRLIGCCSHCLQRHLHSKLFSRLTRHESGIQSNSLLEVSKESSEVKHKQEARTPCPKRVRPLSMMCHSNAAFHTNEGISSLIEEIRKGILRSYHHPLINGWISASFGVIRRAGSKARHLSKRSMKDVKSFISSSFSLIETGGISRDRRSLTGP